MESYSKASPQFAGQSRFQNQGNPQSEILLEFLKEDARNEPQNHPKQHFVFCLLFSSATVTSPEMGSTILVPRLVTIRNLILLDAIPPLLLALLLPSFAAHGRTAKIQRCAFRAVRLLSQVRRLVSFLRE